MFKIYGVFANGEFELNKVDEIKEEEIYLDMKLRKKIMQGKNIYFRYFDNKKSLDKWLNSYIVTNSSNYNYTIINPVSKLDKFLKTC